MFSPKRTSDVRRRALGALSLARSFLLLEDDYEVDWEVGQDERFEVEHPHRAALELHAITDRLASRRPGPAVATAHVCLSPVNRQARSYQRPPVRREGHRQPSTLAP